MIDVKMRGPDGKPVRARQVSPVQTKAGAKTYELQIRRQILGGTWNQPSQEGRQGAISQVNPLTINGDDVFAFCCHLSLIDRSFLANACSAADRRFADLHNVSDWSENTP